jgi:hypothetical protein
MFANAAGKYFQVQYPGGAHPGIDKCWWIPGQFAGCFTVSTTRKEPNLKAANMTGKFP